MSPYVGVFSLGVLKAYFEEGMDTGNPEEVAVLGNQLGIPKAPLLAATCDPDFKRKAKERSEEAVARGIFGSPWFFVDGEPFWGSDRLQMIDLWLERGGW
jgi:2-hydroxychromene-2-carboxylate isomerase